MSCPSEALRMVSVSATFLQMSEMRGSFPVHRVSRKATYSEVGEKKA